MANKFINYIKHSWNAFSSDTGPASFQNYGYGYRQDRNRLSYVSQESIIGSVINRIAIDCAAVDIYHAKINENGNFLEPIDSALNDCLRLDPNIDQHARAFFQDLVMTMLDKGSAIVVPVDTTLNPNETGGYDIQNLRVGTLIEAGPQTVKVHLYNEKTGEKEELVLSKRIVAMIENPLYAVMNEPNSTLDRLQRKLALLDNVDEQIGSKKLDIIIQLPHDVKNDTRKRQAQGRIKDIQDQLAGGSYGVAYAATNERITQLNRPMENNIAPQVDKLTDRLYSELGLTPDVFEGKADEETMLNYNNRTIEPILTSITQEFTRKFLTKTGRSQGQAVIFLRNPFKLMSVSDIAEIADKFTRNAILSSNEIRGQVGYRPVSDPDADVLRNKNLNQEAKAPVEQPTPEKEGDRQNGRETKA